MTTYADFRERVHPDDIEYVEAHRDAVVQKPQRFHHEFRIIRPNGEMRWISSTGSAVYDEVTEEPIRILGSNFDITERKKSEKALRESEERFRSVVNQTGVGISITDLNGTVKFANQKFCKMLGFDNDTELIGKPIWEATYGEVSPENKHLFDRLCDTGEPYEIEKRLIRKDGSPLWAHISVWAVCDATGKSQSTTCVTRDITERKRAEERQTLLVAELDHRVKNVLAQVDVVATSTRQNSRSVDEFLGSLHGRIQAMAAAHTLLSESGWQNVGLDGLVRKLLAPYASGSNVTISGTDAMLNSAETQAVARVLHELATNAAKYGALSVPSGQVSVKWDLKPNGAAANLTLVWRELGGPPVAFDHPSSYGTNLIRNLIPHELGGKVDLVFAKEGVNCRIGFPVRQA
jgi:PAS domain S-box-containing protein